MGTSTRYGPGPKTLARIEDYLHLSGQGMGLPEIADYLGVKPGTLRATLDRWGIDRPRESPEVKWTTANVSRYRELIANGATFGEACAAIGASPRSWAWAMRKNGMELPPGVSQKGLQKRGKVTHCPAGHEYNEENTYYRKQGNRGCRKCAAKQNAEWKARARAEKRAEETVDQ
jgi:hypothetical protein